MTAELGHDNNNNPKNGNVSSRGSQRDVVTVLRWVSQEGRRLLTSLRNGPPHIARGELAQDIMDLRDQLVHIVSSCSSTAHSHASSSATPLNDELFCKLMWWRPFVNVVTDPRAAGPHTLVALRAIHRLLSLSAAASSCVTLLPPIFRTDVMQGILNCQFEQTDAAADEAVELAIADVLGFLLQMDGGSTVSTDLWMEGWNTLFLTQTSFLPHSPALAYHAEELLNDVIQTTMKEARKHKKNDHRLPRLMQFLVHHLLNSSASASEQNRDGRGNGVGANRRSNGRLTSAPASTSSAGILLDESMREAQLTHESNQILCLRLVQTSIQTLFHQNDTSLPACTTTLIPILQDGLCLALLLTGQSIWSSYYYDAHNQMVIASPGLVPLEVLSEICSTISLLWNTPLLRPHLVPQFESIFTGFYTRALVLLRQRHQPHNSITFHANLVFDSEVEIILESLVDLLCLHDHRRSITNGDGGALETLFAIYDCNLHRSDVAAGLYVELCRACGGQIDAEGEAVMTSIHTSSSMDSFDDLSATGPASPEMSRSGAHDPKVNGDAESEWRPVPAHLKELCAQALIGGMKCLFRDDNPSEKRIEERSKRKSIMLKSMVDQEEGGVHNDHFLRDVKSKKRLFRKAARLFNEKASRGIEFLAVSGLLPDPVTPASVAKFLRNAIVLGLDKKAVGAYLGEAGKAPAAGKSPQTWDRDWFHRDVLKEYCNLFHFEGQQLLDGLRMFLAAFRLPGEAQQIDRILQAFADSCSKVCEESSRGSLNLFSEDPKRASDAAYLLSFSIIMLNTDRHNENIREDRKMSVDDFVKNNTDYGRDITDKGKEFPREYLTDIYVSINEEQIRTMGEGADGAMTVERWKDVVRSSIEIDFTESMSLNDAEDLSEIVLEHVWKPIVAAVGAFWGISRSKNPEDKRLIQNNESHNGMLGVQGARLGMDISIEMLHGVRALGRVDIFRKIFSWVCVYTGLLGNYDASPAERISRFTTSVEAQSALVVAFRTALEAGEDLGEDSWKRLWSIIFEMRDLKLLKNANSAMLTLLKESEEDLLTTQSRRDWCMCLVKGDMDFDVASVRKRQQPKSSSMFGSLGRALFGSSEWPNENEELDFSFEHQNPTIHAKEQLLLWDESATSDDEEDIIDESSQIDSNHAHVSAGAQFESHLIRENIQMNEEIQVPVTGLERADELQRFHRSPRARVRSRIVNTSGYHNLVAESRFLNDEGILTQIKSLSTLSAMARGATAVTSPVSPPPVPPPTSLNRSYSDVSSNSSGSLAHWKIPLSQASEAFAEVMICEISLRNKDRLDLLWRNVLQEHYLGSLTKLLVKSSDDQTNCRKGDPGLEKRVSGLLRLSIFAVQREEIADEILSSWSYILPANDDQVLASPLRYLGKHMSEGLFRIILNSDSVSRLGQAGWEGLLSLSRWCAKNGFSLKPLTPEESQNGGLPPDDPAVLCYRSIHHLLDSTECQAHVPCSVVNSVRSLVLVGDCRNCSQLSIASLDMMSLLLEGRLTALKDAPPQDSELFWSSCWRSIVDSVADAADRSQTSVSWC